MTFDLKAIVGQDSRITIVDFGASDLDGSPVYQPIIDLGLAKIIGFEPNPAEYHKIKRTETPWISYLPYAVADGRTHTYYLCKAAGMNSLLEPDQDALSQIPGFDIWGTVVQKEEIKTVRMDDLKELDNIDFIKADVQGAEKMIFENGVNQLKQCMIIHTEVNFSPFYKNHPLFADIDSLLRSLGFVFHCFFDLVKRVIRPLMQPNNLFYGINHTTWGEAVYFKNFNQLDHLEAGKLLKAALIMDEIYGSKDIALRYLWEYDEMIQTNYSKMYLRTLNLEP